MKSYSLVLQTLLMVSAFAASGQGTMIYDQQSATNRSFSGQDYPFQAEQPAGQSFTPTLAAVGFVQLEFVDPHPGDGVGGMVYVNLRADSLTGAILGSTDPVSMPDGFSLGVTNFFFGTPLAVTPGTTYYLQPVLQSGDSLWSIVAGPFNYSGGTFFFNGAPNPNGFNAWFREGVLIPEPSSGLLVLVGFVAMWVMRRLRRLRRGRLLLVQLALGAGIVGSASAGMSQTNLAVAYYSMQHPEWPPLPSPTQGCAVFAITGQAGFWEMNDLDYDYSAAQPLPSMNRPEGQTPDGPLPLDYGTNLWLEITGNAPDSFSMIAHNVDDSKWFQLQSTMDMGPQPTWTIEDQIAAPDGTDISFTVAKDSRPRAFFRAAQSDTLLSITSGGDVLRPNACYTSQPGYFNIQRNVPSSTDLPVYYRISGTATNGVDYAYLDGSTTIAEGAIECQIEADALPSLVGSNLTVTLTLVMTNGYLVDSNAASATMLIRANVFELAASLPWPAIGLDYHPPTQSLLVSLIGGYYHPNFLRIDTNGLNPWVDMPDLTEGVTIATVKATGNGFTNGDMYHDSNGLPNEPPQNPSIGWVSADGTASVRDWVSLPAPWSPLGGLYVDQSGAFGGDLIATAGGDYASGTDGRVWRIDSSKNVTRVADLGGPLGGVITLTNDVAQWGPWAGRIITGQGPEDPLYDPEIYAIDASRQVTTNYLGIQPEHFNLIPPNQSFYCADAGAGAIWKVPAGAFANHAGHLLITGMLSSGGAQPPALYIVHWDAGTTNFVVEEISAPWNWNSGYVQILEDGTFAPIELQCSPLQCSPQ
jgi:hypothetical protein